MSFAANGLNDVLQLFRGVAAARMSGAEAKTAQDQGGGALDDYDKGLRETVENGQRGRREYGDAIRLLESQVFWNHFADDDVGIADDQKRDRKCDAMKKYGRGM